MFGKWFRRSARTNAAARTLYAAVVAQARKPAFYLHYAVPDTATGHFEMICLHMYASLRRLKSLGPEGAALAQATHDAMFADMDRHYREQGIGDLGVGKRVKNLAAFLYGRIGVYDQGITGDEDALAQALRENLYGSVFDDQGAPLADGSSPSGNAVFAMAAYLRHAVAALDKIDPKELLLGLVRFPEIEHEG
ncbi:MAG: hypothetical protein O7C63_03205 [Alphaproteobacteria bacterium]|nr:hypothetical protein [Alphaproteobacteria bacterium]